MSNKRDKNQRKKIVQKRKHASQTKELAQKKAQMKAANFEITTDPIKSEYEGDLPAEVLSKLDACQTELMENANKSLAEIIATLEELKQAYPRIPRIYHNLATAYARAEDEDKANTIILESYQQQPQDLFTRLIYAECCLENDEPEKVAEIFENKFDLKALYPHRNTFHFTEVETFFYITGIYNAKIGNKQAAKICLDILHRIEANQMQVERLEAELNA